MDGHSIPGGAPHGDGPPDPGTTGKPYTDSFQPGQDPNKPHQDGQSGSVKDALSILGSKNDTFAATSGNDTLSVAGGSATSFGGSAYQNFLGSGGLDSVISGSGHTTVNTGGEGGFVGAHTLFENASLIGGTGSDTFAFGPSTQGGAWSVDDFVQGSVAGGSDAGSQGGLLHDTVLGGTPSSGSTIHLDQNTTITLNIPGSDKIP